MYALSSRFLKEMKNWVSENPKPSSPSINSPRVSENPPPSPSPIKLPEFENNSVLEELNGESIDEIETLAENNVTEIIDKYNLGSRRVFKFDFVDDEIDEKFTEKTTEEFGDTKTDELEENQHNIEDLSKKKESKKKEKKKRKLRRHENLKQLRAES
ncbi:unnamed protein product [Vicia faba]|uniref:Uncharacterized protein n=1 Tax=Vicia faba TaxID=3906 RepID=A0AAV0YEK4_VICFA|nr:unnamed protein product [Vicia faba]